MRLRPGARGWCVLAAVVVTFDVLAEDEETLSEAVDRWLLSHPWLTRAVIVVVAMHLGNVLPARFDPIHQAVRMVRRR